MNSELNKQLKATSTLLHNGQLPRAEAAIGQLKDRYESAASVWALASEVSLRQGKVDNALAEVQRAVSLDDQNPKRYVQQARCEVLAGLVAESKMSVNEAVAKGVKEADDLIMLASILVRCDDHARALKMYQEAEAVEPERNELHRGMATVYRFLGQLDKAEKSCDKAVAIDPHDYEMLNLRSSLRTQSTDHNHVEDLSNVLRSGTKNWRGAVQVNYALAKEFEDLEDYDRSFHHLAQGATVRRRNTKYDINDDIKIFGAIEEAVTREAMASADADGDPSRAPIFVLGLPRTGSTLVERIISSHSEVNTAGELNDFAIEMLKLVAAKNDGRQPSRLDLPKAALAINMQQLGHNYVEAALERVVDGVRFIDKLPLNSLYIGWIKLALPNAKIVHVERHPLDACLAMYKFLFKNAYPFSYDLSELATYYIEHHRLMAHWRDLLPAGWILDIGYEDLVTDQQRSTEELLKYLELPWEDACLDFHLNAQFSTTGSASQIREPIYDSSVGKWRVFERHLQPLIERLEDAGIVV